MSIVHISIQINKIICTPFGLSLLTFRSWHFGCAPESVWFLRMQCGGQLGHLWPVLVNGSVTGAPSRKSTMNKQRAPSAEQHAPQPCRSLLSQAKPRSWPCNTAIVKPLELRVHLLSMTRKHFHHVTGDMIVCCCCFFNHLLGQE